MLCQVVDRQEVVYCPIETAAMKLREKASRIQDAVDCVQECTEKEPDVGPLSMQLNGKP